VTRESLERALAACQRAGRRAKALVLINPGNPTGRVLREGTLAEIAEFCAGNGLWLLADEVYQENVYAPGVPFVSARAAVRAARRLRRDDRRAISGPCCPDASRLRLFA
jgi:alanine transaminase